MKLAIYPHRANGYVVAPMLPDNHDADKRAVARAQKKRLEDAAPDLLEALEYLLPLAYEAWNKNDERGNRNCDLISRAQAAVRKARGI